MRILVAGGAGYIGSHVAKQLLKSGYQPVVFDNLSTGLRSNVIDGVEFIEGDILSPGDILSALNGIDAVMHLAAFKSVSESMAHPEKYFSNNISGSVNLLNAMTIAGVKKIIFSSSAAVYGQPLELPIDESHPTEPLSFYGYTKLAVENLLSWYDKLKGIKFVALRYFNAVGYDPDGQISGLEKNPQNLLPIIFDAATGRRDKVTILGGDYPTADGTCVRDYVHVSDLADGHIRALEYLDRGESVILNLASGRGISVKEMVDAVKRQVGVDFMVEMGARRYGDAAQIFASAEKAESMLGWKPAYSDLNTIIKTTLQVYEKNQKN